MLAEVREFDESCDLRRTIATRPAKRDPEPDVQEATGEYIAADRKVEEVSEIEPMRPSAKRVLAARAVQDLGRHHPRRNREGVDYVLLLNFGPGWRKMNIDNPSDPVFLPPRAILRKAHPWRRSS